MGYRKYNNYNNYNRSNNGSYKKNYGKKKAPTRHVVTQSGKDLAGYWKNGAFHPYKKQK